MAIKKPQQYREYITAISENVAVNYKAYCNTSLLLKEVGVVLPDYDDTLAQAIQQSINAYIREVCKEVSKANQGDTTRIFTLCDLKFTGTNLPKSLDPYRSNISKQQSVQLVLDEILNQFDFEAFVCELQRNALTLEARGKADVAQCLSSSFSLKASYRHDIIKRTARHFCFNNNHHAGWAGKYEYDTANKIQHLKNTVEIVAKEFGVMGLSPPFQALADAISSGNKTVPSGTSFGNSGTVLIKVFKGHIRYSITPEMMDVIVTYIKLYAPDIELCELPQVA